MTTTKRERWGLRIGERKFSHNDERYYTYLICDGKSVSYVTGEETSIALSNFVQEDAAELRFALEQARDAQEAKQTLMKVINKRWADHTDTIPTVQVLP